MDYVHVSDVEVHLRRSLAPSEVPYVAQAIQDATVVLAARVGDLTQHSPALVSLVIRKAVVAQLLRGADGLDSITVSVDDASTTKRYRPGAGVVFEDEWLSWLTSEAGGGSFEIVLSSSWVRAPGAEVI